LCGRACDGWPEVRRENRLAQSRPACKSESHEDHRHHHLLHYPLITRRAGRSVFPL